MTSLLLQRQCYREMGLQTLQKFCTQTWKSYMTSLKHQDILIRKRSPLMNDFYVNMLAEYIVQCDIMSAETV